MLEQYTLLDIVRVFLWGFFGAIPIAIGYVFGWNLSESKQEDSMVNFILILIMFGGQIAFGVAAYMAGSKG